MSFGDKQLFSNLSFSLRKGEMLGVIGANGTGWLAWFFVALHVACVFNTLCFRRKIYIVENHCWRSCARRGRRSHRRHCRSRMDRSASRYGSSESVCGVIAFLFVCVCCGVTQETTQEATVFEEISQGASEFHFGAHTLPTRQFVSSFNFKGRDQNKLVHQLSGGERGRVGMAKMVGSAPNVMLLDEPVSVVLALRQTCA